MTSKVLLLVATLAFSSPVLACDLTEAEAAFDAVDDVFMSMSGSETVGYGCADDECKVGRVFIGMINADEIAKVNEVFRDGLKIKGCTVEFEKAFTSVAPVRKLLQKAVVN